jgi:predicted MFS family arabinose efflux permease
VRFWSVVLTTIPALIAIALWRQVGQPGVAVVAGLAVFGVVFAMNSSIHSYMILAYSDADAVSVNVGFYYMANAAGRLVGTLLSGAMVLVGGLQACLWTSTLLVAAAALVSSRLPSPPRQQQAEG